MQFASEAERRRFEMTFFMDLPTGITGIPCGHTDHPSSDDVPAVCLLTIGGQYRLRRKGYLYRPVCQHHKDEAIKILTK